MFANSAFWLQYSINAVCVLMYINKNMGKSKASG